jgi:hypothetical protein
MPVKPSFRVGDAVVVKSGVLCPDKPTVSLAGWQGWVTELYPAEGTLAFKWDSPTMRSKMARKSSLLASKGGKTAGSCRQGKFPICAR